MQRALQPVQTAKPVQGPVDEAAAVAAIQAPKQTGRAQVPGPPRASAVGKLARTPNAITGIRANVVKPPMRTAL